MAITRSKRAEISDTSDPTAFWSDSEGRNEGIGPRSVTADPRAIPEILGNFRLLEKTSVFLNVRFPV
jgi:hypothetical protein